jgi:hypothetical protein
MPRYTTQTAPTRQATQEEIQDVVNLFEGQRLAFIPYSTRIALRMHSSDQAKLLQMVEFLGGRVAPFAGTFRWLLYGEPLKTMLATLRDLVGEQGRSRIDRAMEAISLEKASLLETEERGLEDFIKGKLLQARGEKIEEATPPSPRVEVDAKIPPGPWEADEPILEMAEDEPRTFQADSEEAASSFAQLARDAGFDVKQDGLLLFVERPHVG